MVERRGHEVVTVGSAEEAEVELANQSFRFLDWPGNLTHLISFLSGTGGAIVYPATPFPRVEHRSNASLPSPRLSGKPPSSHFTDPISVQTSSCRPISIRGGMGRVATIERLRDLDPNVAAIICSGYSDEAALSEFLSYGFRAALSKPFTRHELANVLQRALEIPSRPPPEIGSRRNALAFADFIELTEKSSDVALISSLVPPERISLTIQHNEGGETFYAELTG